MALVFVRNQAVDSATGAIHAAPDAQPLACRIQANNLSFILRQLFVQTASRLHGRIVVVGLLDLFQAQQPFEAGQWVQRRDAKGRFG